LADAEESKDTMKMTNIAKNTTSLFAVGTLAVGMALALNSGAEAKPVKSEHYNAKVLSAKNAPKMHRWGTTTTSFIQVLKRGHWRITQRVTVVKSFNGAIKRRSVSVLSRKWVG
jgi:hypothetical protein